MLDTIVDIPFFFAQATHARDLVALGQVLQTIFDFDRLLPGGIKSYLYQSEFAEIAFCLFVFARECDKISTIMIIAFILQEAHVRQPGD